MALVPVTGGALVPHSPSVRSFEAARSSLRRSIPARSAQKPREPATVSREPRTPCPPPAAPAAIVLDRVQLAQVRLDRILALAQSGRAFTPAQLLVLQTQVVRASHEIDFAGRLVEKGTSGLKQVLQTQV